MQFENLYQNLDHVDLFDEIYKLLEPVDQSKEILELCKDKLSQDLDCNQKLFYFLTKTIIQSYLVLKENNKTTLFLDSIHDNETNKEFLLKYHIEFRIMSKKIYVLNKILFIYLDQQLKEINNFKIININLYYNFKSDFIENHIDFIEKRCINFYENNYIYIKKCISCTDYGLIFIFDINKLITNIIQLESQMYQVINEFNSDTKISSIKFTDSDYFYLVSKLIFHKNKLETRLESKLDVKSAEAFKLIRDYNKKYNFDVLDNEIIINNINFDLEKVKDQTYQYIENKFEYNEKLFVSLDVSELLKDEEINYVKQICDNVYLPMIKNLSVEPKSRFLIYDTTVKDSYLYNDKKSYELEILDTESKIFKIRINEYSSNLEKHLKNFKYQKHFNIYYQTIYYIFYKESNKNINSWSYKSSGKQYYTKESNIFNILNNDNIIINNIDNLFNIISYHVPLLYGAKKTEFNTKIINKISHNPHYYLCSIKNPFYSEQDFKNLYKEIIKEIGIDKFKDYKNNIYLCFVNYEIINEIIDYYNSQCYTNYYCIDKIKI